ncbi:hypothetical protein BH10ACI1_BH10ACI1_03000 [soil metagenome]
MNRNSVVQSYNSQNTISKFRDSRPKSYTIITLHFDANRIFNDKLAPFFLQIRAFPQNLIFKVSRVFVIWHIIFFTTKRSRLQIYHEAANNRIDAGKNHLHATQSLTEMLLKKSCFALMSIELLGAPLFFKQLLIARCSSPIPSIPNELEPYTSFSSDLSAVPRLKARS